ncbi:YdcF family protein [Sphingomonas solaris]|uniref:YdcF family protein n=1 Tax=Alterirhizorhabdus solaris TaxID=2529389 RepID=A0A558QR69_9SPHN|nr:YdcF family protein [Sphingomonas solaris]TVV69640.1 YdcF family protein [Sphingomonas solaris]
MIARAAAALLLLWALGFAWFAIDQPGPAPDAAVTDAIVVVTGGPGRVQRGLDLLAAGRAQRLLVSGADRRVRPLELAEVNHVSPALVVARVDLGHEAVDTRSNADETAGWLARHRFRSVRLVTTDWHMSRACFELRRIVGDRVTILPDAVRSEPGFTALFKEYHKYLLRRVAAPLGW